MKRILSILISLFVAIALCIGIEATFRFINPNFTEENINYDWISNFLATTQVFEREDDYYISKYFPTKYYKETANDYRARILAQPTEKNFRVFVYGGSSTAGAPFGHWASFSRYLNHVLNQFKKPDVNLEVINLGASGFGSTRVRKIIENTIDKKPNMIIVYTGHNETCDEIIARKLYHYEKLSHWLVANSQLVQYLYLQRAKSALLDSKQTFEAPNCDTDDQSPIDNERLATIFKDNMEAVAKLAEDNNFQVIFLSQYSHIMKPPEMPQSVYSAQELKDIAGLRKSYFDYSFSKHPEMFFSVARQFIKEHPKNAFGYYYLGVIYRQTGKVKEAVTNLYQALEHDAFAQRYRLSYTKILQNIGKKYQNSHFVDTIKPIETAIGDPFIDGRMILDVMHPNVTGNKIIARTILDEAFKKMRLADKYFYSQQINSNLVFDVQEAPEKYLLICMRYLKMGNFDQCLAKLKKTYYATYKSMIARSLNIRFWELLLAYGEYKKDPMIIEESNKIFNYKHNN